MFPNLQNEVLARILAAQFFFKSVLSLGKEDTTRVLKGLIFVQLYAVYEFTVVGIVRAALAEIKQRATPINTLRLELLALALHPEVSAVAECSLQRRWSTRIELFQRTDSSDAIGIDDTVFPADGSHYRPAQLQTIWALFGISEPIVPRLRLLPLIEELVDNRNAIAHGRKTGAEVGKSYTDGEIENKILATQEICLHLIQTMEAFCLDPANICR